MFRPVAVLVAAFAWCVPLCVAQSPGTPVRVYVLAGQSNMEGKAQNILWEHQATAAGTAEVFAHLRDGDGWAVRDDVFVRFGGRSGPLTLGFGSPERTGVELEFGTVLGERSDEPVLLIKTCWGGRSLYKDFRPPSLGLPPAEELEAELEKARARVQRQNEKNGRDEPLPTMEEIRAAYGRDYRRMMQEVRETLERAGAMFPALEGRDLVVSGFVWHQGWNDQYNGYEESYADNLAALVLDVRKDLGVPDLPVVVGVMGQNGSKPAKGAMKTIQDAQLALAKRDGFRGNVRSVRTDVLVDRAAEELYPQWKRQFELWQKTGSDHPYHYLGSAIWHVRMGRAFARAMLELEGRD